MFSRRHRTIRWCKENADCMCNQCHAWYGENPADSGEWITRKKGENVVNRVRIKREMSQKVSKIEEKEIAKHYRLEYRRMEQELLNGATKVDFTSWQ